MRIAIGSIVTSVLVVTLFATPLGCKQKQKPAETDPDTAAETAVEAATAQKAPAFSLPDLNGTPVSLSSLRGKGVIVDFWATWCPPCVKEIPHFVELYDAYKDKGLAIVGVSLDDTKEDIEKYLQEQKVTYPILHADKMTLSKLTNDYGGVQFIPTTFFISPDGNIVERLEGYHTKAELEQIVTKILPNG
jgi:peroxiredoxin